MGIEEIETVGQFKVPTVFYLLAERRIDFIDGFW